MIRRRLPRSCAGRGKAGEKQLTPRQVCIHNLFRDGGRLSDSFPSLRSGGRNQEIENPGGGHVSALLHENPFHRAGRGTPSDKAVPRHEFTA